jgi:signal recognition particle subunit SRP54
MVLDNLGESLRSSLRKVANASHVDEDLVEEIVKDIQRALLQADVNVKLALEITNNIEERALEEEPPGGVSSREHVVRIVHDELVDILGEPKELDLQDQVIMMVGLYGQGKTTTTGKLAHRLQKKGLKPGLVAADVHRPAAYDQLDQLGDQVGVPVYGDPDAEGNADEAVRVVEEGLDDLQERCDVVIVDTSGRHKLQDDLIDEMRRIFEAVDPDEKFLIVDAQTGQEAGPQAQAFEEAVGVSGVVITKLDGTAKGGGALSAVAETGAPVTFVGTGEGVEDLEAFDPDSFISRLLGMGDLETLLERAEQAVEDEEEAEELAERIMSGEFTLVELREQMEMLDNMGPLDKVMDMIPGVGGIKDQMPDNQLSQTKDQMEKFKIIMDSMTEWEMRNPSEIKSSRTRRIAMGAGVAPKDVKELLKYHRMSKRTMEGFQGERGAQQKLMKQLDFGDMDPSDMM